MLQKIRWLLLLVGVSLIVIVAFQNSRSVELHVLFFSGQYPLTLLLLACSAASFVLGALTTGWMLRSRGRMKSKGDSTRPAKSSQPGKSPSKTS